MKLPAVTTALGIVAVGCGQSYNSKVQIPPQVPTFVSQLPEQPDSTLGEVWSPLGQKHRTIEMAPDSHISKMPEIRFDDYPATVRRGPPADIAPGIILNALPGGPTIREGASIWNGELVSSEPSLAAQTGPVSERMLGAASVTTFVAPR